MSPTLLRGDYVLAERLADPFEGPNRGDVIAFELPKNRDLVFVRRLIGLPGDRIRVADGILHVNGEPVTRESAGTVVLESENGEVEATAYLEKSPGGRSYRVVEVSDHADLDDTPVYTVPPGHYFFMGDNRDRTLDGRNMSEVGFIPADHLIGRARILSFSHDGLAVRFGRIGQEIE
jgi:signal peptidase I